MENKPLISVIMNCFNSGAYLKEALDSVIAQTYQNWEIIFWDNQSTDNSANIVRSYKDKRIQYFYAPEHTKLGEARNQALMKAKGEYISFLDCDDLYFPSKLEENLLAFEDETIGLIYSNGYTLFDKKNINKIFYRTLQPKGDVFESWLACYQVMIPSVMFKKNILAYLDYWFDNSFDMIEEFDFFIRISKISKINYINMPLCIWRAHSASMTWQKKESFENEYKIFLKKILKQYSELSNKQCIKKLKAKIAFHHFYNNWVNTGVVNRKFITPFLLIDQRLVAIYLLSFFSLKNFNNILKFIGKNV